MFGIWGDMGGAIEAICGCEGRGGGGGGSIVVPLPRRPGGGGGVGADGYNCVPPALAAARAPTPRSFSTDCSAERNAAAVWKRCAGSLASEIIIASFKAWGKDESNCTGGCAGCWRCAAMME